MLALLAIWISCVSCLAYYIDRSNPKIAKKSAFIGSFLALLPVFGIVYLVYLYLTAKRRLVTAL